MKSPVEAKVAASSIAALVVPALFAAAAWYHWFTPPPPALQAAIIAVVTGVAGWLAPHTNRTPLLSMTPADLKMIRAVAAWLKGEPPPAAPPAQPPAGNTP